MPQKKKTEDLYFRRFDVFASSYEAPSFHEMMHLKNKIYELYESTTQKLKLKRGLTDSLKDSLEQVVGLCELAISQYADDTSFVDEVKHILRCSYLAISDPLKFLALNC